MVFCGLGGGEGVLLGGGYFVVYVEDNDVFIESTGRKVFNI